MHEISKRMNIKNLIYSFVLLFTFTQAPAQATQIELKSPYNYLTYHKTTVKEAKKSIGKPSKIRDSWMNANLGWMCLRTYYTHLYYNKDGTQLTFYSGEKNEKDRKVFSTIQIDSNSTIFIHPKIKLNVSDTTEVKNELRIATNDWYAEDDFQYNYTYLCMLGSIPVETHFIFNQYGILKRITIYKDFDNTTN